MGLIIAASIAGLVWLVLWRSRVVRGPALQLLGATLLIGLAGYALQGRTGLSGSPASEQAPRSLPPVMPIELAALYYGRFNGATSWIIIANSYMSRGDSANAVMILQSAIKARPLYVQLHVALANALVTHSGGRISPAAALSFKEAGRLSPKDAGLAFFFGLALLQQGEVDPGLAVWNKLLANSAASSPWQVDLRTRIGIVERLRDQAAPR